MQTEILKFFSLGGIALAIHVFFTLFINKKKHRNFPYLVTVLVVMGINLLFVYINVSEIAIKPHFLNYLFVPFNYLLGPSYYFFFFLTIEDNFKVTTVKKILLLPGPLLMLILLILGFLKPDIFPADHRHFFKTGQILWTEMTLIVALLYNIVFFFRIYLTGKGALTRKILKSEASARIFLFLLVLIGLINVYGLTAFLTREIIHLYIISIFITILISITSIFGLKNPELLNDLEEVIETSRYKRSQIAGLDLKNLQLELASLMLNEHLYEREDLSLNYIAERLEIKSHQLSEFLNKHLNVNFSRFVNGHRIEKAKRLLRENKDANILEVAYSVGFNSKANFHISFNSLVGITPSEYQKSLEK